MMEDNVIKDYDVMIGFGFVAVFGAKLKSIELLRLNEEVETREDMKEVLIGNEHVIE